LPYALHLACLDPLRNAFQPQLHVTGHAYGC
jgi:hypothetical protein